jgi:hypothetical protein
LPLKVLSRLIKTLNITSYLRNRKLIDVEPKGDIDLSFGSSFKNLGTVLEIIVIGLMLIFMFDLIYFNLDFWVKLGIAALTFTLMILALIASQILTLQKEAAQQQ